MAEIKFNCPRCAQKIALDELWAGQQLQCPACNETITVPVQHAAPIPTARPAVAAPVAAGAPPPPAPQVRLSIGRSSPPHSTSPASSGPAPAAARAKPVYRDHTRPKESGGAMKWVKIGVGAIVLCAAGYFAFTWILKEQDKLNASRKADEANADGGQVGHIADLYDVLDRTDPEKMGRFEKVPRQGVPRSPRTAKTSVDSLDMADLDADGKPKPPPKALPLLPAVWTLDLAAAKIPEGKANGMIAGTNFVVQVARLDPTPTAYVLRLIQGSLTAPESELIVYLHPKPGEKVAGGVWNIAKDMKGSAVPQIAKRWKPNPKFAPTTKSFPSGYAMKLELGLVREGEISGKIFLALPDPEKTVVAGIFTAATSLPDSVTPAAPAPTAQPRVPVAGQVRPEDRYGVSGGLP